MGRIEYSNAKNIVFNLCCFEFCIFLVFLSDQNIQNASTMVSTMDLTDYLF